jgi:hypothetical protein
LSEALRRRRERSDLAAHRIADAHGMRARRETRGKRFEHAPRETREQTVGHARDCVLLMDDERPARQPRRDAARSRDESARAEHDVRPATPHHLQALPDCERQLERRGEPGCEALAAQSADADPLDLDVLRRNELRLEPALCAEPHRLVAALAQYARSSERRKNVTAGAARHDEHGAALHCVRSRRGTASRPAALAS